MSTVAKNPTRPDFMRKTRCKQSRHIDQHNPYQSVAAIYVLRMAMSLKNHLTARQLSALFEDDLGIFTGLADVRLPGVNALDDLEFFLEDEDEDAQPPRKASKSDLIKHIRDHLNYLMMQNIATHAPLFKNISGLAETLSLNETEQELLVVRLLMDVFPDMNMFLVEHCSRCTPAALQQYLQMMTTRSARDIQRSLRPEGRLNQLGWLRVMPKVVDLEDKLRLASGLLEILLTEHDSVQSLFANFYRESKASSLSLDDYGHLQEQLNVLVPYLKAALEERKIGVNVLVYGPPGTGKTELAKLLATAVEAQLFEVCHTDKEGDAISGKARFAAYKVTGQLLAKRTESSLVMFDEAEDVFPNKRNFLLFGDDEPEQAGDKAWINFQLENNPVPVIWIVNKTRGMDTAYLRRFDYSLQLDKMPLPLRRRLVLKYTKNLDIDDGWRDQLAKHSDITPAQIARASAIVKTSQRQSQVSDQQIMESVLNASNQLLNKTPLNIKAPSWTAFNLAFTNTSSETPLIDIINGLKRNPRGTLCFYGAPGTGKTALGQHIAEQIGLPIIVKKASDLLDMYVGQSEKNIARMFQDAQKQGAILLLDEADSLLSDRRDAHQRWEVSQVNEMLTQMERYTGIFICTTNLMEKLDTASLRRFDFKIEFNYLTAEQRWALFEQELTRLNGSLPTATDALASLKQRVHRLTQLTPGDFAVVNRRHAVLGNIPDPERMIEVLTQECKAKGEKFSQIGFVK